jgi:hypothetical protein
VPPRFAYWTILAGGLPTAFRAVEREDLLPTLRRLQERHPDAEMRWFARGKLWESPEAARVDIPPARSRVGGVPPRGRDWRPGGSHHDPRQPFKDKQREKNQVLRKERFRRKQDLEPRRRTPVGSQGGGEPPEQQPPSTRPSRPLTPTPAAGTTKNSAWTGRPRDASSRRR